MTSDALIKLIFTVRVSSDSKKGSIPVWSELLHSLDLPGLSLLMESPWSRTSRKNHVKCLLKTNVLLSHQLDSSCVCYVLGTNPNLSTEIYDCQLLY